ncbi:MAG: riboflavin synthase [Deltaproteobacteria bacterium]|nr:riboflavin synthase [Deltaproteobacteria bacterium]
MFTGIIEDIGRVKSVEKRGSFGRITVETALITKDVKTGDSIAVNGACLTATSLAGKSFCADVSAETLNVTTLGGLKSGDRVNLELALTLSKPLGGHMVTGHVDGVGVMRRKTSSGENLVIEVEAPESVLAQIVKKGSVAVDGISLTVAELLSDAFTVAIIPHTLSMTNLLSKGEGSKVNLETDLIGKYVEKFLLTRGASRVTEDFLAENGFFRKR